MPVTFSPRGSSNERAQQFIMDWAKRVMQLSSLAVILLYSYLLYGIMFGGIGHWATIAPSVNGAPAQSTSPSQPAARDHSGKPIANAPSNPSQAPALLSDEQKRLAANVDGAIQWLNIALGILLLSCIVLYYDEDYLGYTFVILGLFLFYGMPFLFDTFFTGQIQEWEKTNNFAALAIYRQIRLASLMMAIPGAILALRDLVLRVTDGSSRSRERFTAMEYGGGVKEEEPPSPPIIGVFAKCWQLPFCRNAIRRKCPIFHARSRCWKERVGCMCEENVIRTAMESIINKTVLMKDPPTETPTLAKAAEPEHVETPEIEGFVIDATASGEGTKYDSGDKDIRQSWQQPTPAPAQITTTDEAVPAPGHVKIPYNTKLSDSAKRERCRNCVIYNEHQRMKYQFLSPLFVLLVPALALWQIDALTNGLRKLMSDMDNIMARLSMNEGAKNSGIATSLSTTVVAEYMIIGCLVVIVSSLTLRFLERCIFQWKI